MPYTVNLTKHRADFYNRLKIQAFTKGGLLYNKYLDFNPAL